MSPISLRGTVLIAEDEVMLALWIEDLVAALGCRVLGPAASLEQLLKLIARSEPDVALLDVALMHGESVYPAANLLRERGIPFAFVTAYDAAALDRDYAQEPVLRKPYTAGEVRRCVHRLLARSGSLAVA